MKEIILDRSSNFPYLNTDVTFEESIVAIKELLKKFKCDEILVHESGRANKIAFKLGGMPYIIEFPLIYVGGSEATSAKLETTASLRQPEVSIAMKQMIDRGWADERDGVMTGKGRPYKIYSLKLPFKDIITELEEQQRKIGAGAQAKIERLKELARAS